MDPLSWFQQNVKVPSWMRTPAPSTGGSIVPTGGSLVPSPGGSVGPPVQSIRTNLNVPGGTPRGAGLVRSGAQTVGLMGAQALAESAGRPGSSRMSLLGGDAPVYQTPLNDVTPQQVADDKAERGRRLSDVAYTPSGVINNFDTLTPEQLKEALELAGPAPEVTPVPRGDGGDDAPDGSGAKGTNTGYKIDLGIAEGLLGRIGERNGSTSMGSIANVNTFTSQALPTTPQGAVQQDIGLTGVALPDTSNPQVVEGISTPGLYGTSPVDTADNNRAISIPGENPEGSARNWMEPGEKSWSDARRAAFLDPNNRGYGAVRAANAATGTFRQGDKFFANDGGTLREIGEDTYRTASQRQLSPAELQAGYKEEIQATLVPAAQPDITSNLNVDAALTPGIPEASSPQIAGIAEIEFGMNNNPPSGDIDREELKANYFKEK